SLADDEHLPVSRDVAQPRAHAQPVGHGPGLVRDGGAKVKADSAVNRALLDRILAKHAVLGIDPRPREPVAFLAVRPCTDTERGVALPPHKKVAIAFVGDPAAITCVVE